MAAKTEIAWTDSTWSPITGCTKVSPGCAYCYAEAMTKRFGGDFSKVTLHPERLKQPLHWRNPRRIFVCSMSDLFHEDVPHDFMHLILKTIWDTPRHTYQVLTKRIDEAEGWAWEALPENIWLGTSVENQRWFDCRIRALARCEVKTRFLSCEPLLGPIEGLVGWGLDQVIVGGESGPGFRPMQIEWLEDIVAQCKAVGIPVFVKQDAGRWPGRQGRIPDDLWAVKEFPKEASHES